MAPKSYPGWLHLRARRKEKTVFAKWRQHCSNRRPNGPNIHDDLYNSGAAVRSLFDHLACWLLHGGHGIADIPQYDYAAEARGKIGIGPILSKFDLVTNSSCLSIKRMLSRTLTGTHQVSVMTAPYTIYGTQKNLCIPLYLFYNYPIKLLLV
jgi:hypothetical protein